MSDPRPVPQILIPPPGPRARALIERDASVASPSYIKEYPLVVERGEGPWLWDVDGNRFLDFMAGIAVCATGHAHPSVVAAIHEASSRFLHVCGTDFYYESFTALCERLAGFVPGMGAKRVFLTNSGAEAVEAAIKLARFHTRRPYVVAFEGSFHGRTLGALSLTASKTAQRAFFAPLLPSVHHVPYSNPGRCPYGHPRTECESACECAARIEGDLFATRVDPREVAAIVVEPVLGEGGYVPPAPSFLADLRELCDRHGILLVFDEVQCGVGRTGAMFAAERCGVAPDVLLSAKGLASGLPLGAVIARADVMTWTPGTHGSTFGGNPVCCAAALATLDVVEPRLARVSQLGERLLAGLRSLRERYAMLSDARGVGLMVGAEMAHPDTGQPDHDLAERLERRAFHKGLLLLMCGRSTLRFAPPLIVEDHEVDVALELFEQCLADEAAGAPV